ncbi:peroxidase 24 [Nicotiana tomentosiformis]|uniref:peroxidase 24 n=1 Tax=Nicotiana tomentosiformis TaxID=4098 RepID=UPI00051B62E2|nr:peroxidase 24-like [Nicotiana tomentosiformis]
MKQSNLVFLLLVTVVAFGICNADKLKMNYYHKSCPSVERIVREITWSRVAADPSLPAKLLRLHYHDCFVRGCDASVLLDSTPKNSAEKAALPNRSLGGYEVIDDIKKKLEQVCPHKVSCADILALVTRDAVSYQFGRSMWKIPTGRKDGRVSKASEALASLPSPFANFTTLLRQFQDNDLDIVDLVTLSGAHTIGITHCTLVAKRLYNFTGKGDADPSLNPNYATTLRTMCPNPINPKTVLELDPKSSLSFDSHYYEALNQNKGLLRSDAALLTNSHSAQIVRKLQNPHVFLAFFSRSMKKMGDIRVLADGEGEIRKNCRAVNA